MDKRDEIIERLKKQLDQWNKDLDVLEKKGKGAREELRTAAENQLKELKDRRKEFQAHFEELQKSGEGAWKEMARGLDKASGAIKSSFDKALEHLKD